MTKVLKSQDNTASSCSAWLRAASRQSNQSPGNQATAEEVSGFLEDYASLKTSPTLGDTALTLPQPGREKSLRGYLAVVVDPVEVYLATDADAALIPDGGPEAIGNYFQIRTDQCASATPFPWRTAPAHWCCGFAPQWSVLTPVETWTQAMFRQT